MVKVVSETERQEMRLLEFCTKSILPYPREKPPMGGTPYIGFRTGGWADIRSITVTLKHRKSAQVKSSNIRDLN